MQCWLAGAFTLEGDDDRERAIAIRLTGPSLRHLFSTGSIVVVGEVHAESFAEGRSLEGEIHLASRRASYALRFSCDEGTSLVLVGTQELSFRRPPRGFSVVVGDIRRGERTVGRARLRLDPRDSVRGLFSWA